MYRLERVYVQENWLFYERSEIFHFFSCLIEAYRRGIEAARAAEKNPKDSEAIHRILEMD